MRSPRDQTSLHDNEVRGTHVDSMSPTHDGNKLPLRRIAHLRGQLLLHDNDDLWQREIRAHNWRV